jgi:hypothetical protein
MRKRLVGVLILTALLPIPCVSKVHAAREGTMGGAVAGHDTGGISGDVGGEARVGAVPESAVGQTQLKLAQQQPPYAAAPPAEGSGPGEWVEVPGQRVGGTWVPAHKAWVSASPPGAAGKAGQYPPPPVPEAPPGYGQASPGEGYYPPPPYAFPAAPEVVPVPGTYVYFVPDIGVDILFYHGYWYRPYRGYWYRALSYNGPWLFYPRVPHALIALPPGYQRLPPGYRRIPHADLQRNWARWEREKHREHHH